MFCLHWCKWGGKDTTQCVTVNFLFLWLLAFPLFIELFLCWVHKYLQVLYLLLGLIFSSFSDFLLVSCYKLFFKPCIIWYEYWYSSFLSFPFGWNIFFPSLTFILKVSLGLKWVSCRQHMHGPCFCIHSASLCLLVGEFNQLTFRIIIDIYVPITISLVALGLFCSFFFFFFPSLVFPV